MAKIRGAFLNNFFNVAMGLSLLPLIDQFLQPVHPPAVADATWEIVSSSLPPLNSRTDEVDREDRIKKLLADDWQHSMDVAPFTWPPWSFIPEKQIGIYIREVERDLRREAKSETPIKAQQDSPANRSNAHRPKGKSGAVSDSDDFAANSLPDAMAKKLKDTLPKVNAGIANTCSQQARGARFLMIIMFLFVIKYVHEADRVEGLLLGENKIAPAFEFVFFAARICALLVVIILSKAASWHIDSILVVLLFASFVLSDLAVIILYSRKRLAKSPLIGSVKTEKLVKRLLWIWGILDGVLVLFAIWEHTVDLEPMSVAIVLALQILVPYAGAFSFYFGDFDLPPI
jgi:hypothetical protein